jgi:hypothetical protein
LTFAHILLLWIDQVRIASVTLERKPSAKTSFCFSRLCIGCCLLEASGFTAERPRHLARKRTLTTRRRPLAGDRAFPGRKALPRLSKCPEF